MRAKGPARNSVSRVRQARRERCEDACRSARRSPLLDASRAVDNGRKLFCVTRRS